MAVNCPGGGKTYQSCNQSSGSVTTIFGTSICVCNVGDVAGCQQCAQELASYCGGDGGAGSGDCMPGARNITDQYVFDTILLPLQQTDYAMDLVGDGHPVNQFGSFVAALIQENLMPQAALDASLQSGQNNMLLGESSSDASFQHDSCAAASVQAGAATTMPPTAGASYTATGSPSRFAGPITNGGFSSAPPATTKMPVSLPLLLPLFGPTPITVVGAHLQFSFVNGRVVMGQINGGIRKSDIDTIVIPALAKTLESKILADQGRLTSADMFILSLFDIGGVAGPAPAGCATTCARGCQNPSGVANACGCAAAGDGVIDECEVAASSLTHNLVMPDIQLFDADGNYKPNPNPTAMSKDSVSIGIAFTAVPARF
jgi:hypothetical protein